MKYQYWVVWMTLLDWNRCASNESYLIYNCRSQ